MDSANWHLVVLPYVEGTSERIAQVMRKHQVPVAMRPVKTLKSLLVHPKDEQEKEEITDCVYKIPWACCEICYIGETGRKFGTRLLEHKTEVESITSKPFTRNQCASSLSEQNKSALTDHASHVMWMVIPHVRALWLAPVSKVLDGSNRQYIFGKKDGSPWTGTRGATCWATRTTNFLPCRITIVARTGRGIEQTSSDEGLW